jgi:hypothetical protein
MSGRSLPSSRALIFRILERCANKDGEEASRGRESGLYWGVLPCAVPCSMHVVINPMDMNTLAPNFTFSAARARCAKKRRSKSN